MAELGIYRNYGFPVTQLLPDARFVISRFTLCLKFELIGLLASLPGLCFLDSGDDFS